MIRHDRLVLVAAATLGLLLFSNSNHAQTMTAPTSGVTDTKTSVHNTTSTKSRETETTEIRPFTVHIPEAQVADLKRRLQMTRWPNKELVADRSQGVQLATLKELVRYWTTEYDWRKAEARLNSYPQFVTNIDGVDIHFIHVKSKHPNAMPMIMTHGWPGSVIELLGVIDPLTNPTAHGGQAEDA